jgi:hypothetical protein
MSNTKPPSTSAEPARIRRERQTIQAMIQLYCQDHHATRNTLCESCTALHSYALARLDRCIYAPDKPTCVNCPTHCYKPDMREQVRVVMRYAGPRMLTKHPILAILHLIDGKLDKRRTITRKPKS